jgi:phosphate-selective porin OprO/OprP
MGGRIQFDMLADDSDEHLDSGTDMRRLRLYAKGKIDQNWKYKLQYDFSESKSKDLYLTYTGFDALNITLGQASLPMFLDSYTSSKWTIFIERAVTDNFAHSREQGIHLAHAGSNYSLYSSLSADHSDSDEATDTDAGTSGDDNWTSSSRFTFAPLHDNGSVLHLGLTAVLEQAGSASYGARPGSKVDGGEKLVTSSIDPNNQAAIGAELAMVASGFSAQAEYVQVDVEARTGNDQSYNAWYVQSSVLLNGGSRSYDVDGGYFGRPTNTNGAWELAARFDAMDLSDENNSAPLAGKLANTTVGINYYANKNVRLTLNLVNSKTDYNQESLKNADINLVQLRTQVAF